MHMYPLDSSRSKNILNLLEKSEELWLFTSKINLEYKSEKFFLKGTKPLIL